MFLTGKHLVTVDLFLKICVCNSCFLDLTQPLFSPLLVSGVSFTGQFPDADSFRPPARTTAKKTNSYRRAFYFRNDKLLKTIQADRTTFFSV